MVLTVDRNEGYVLRLAHLQVPVTDIDIFSDMLQKTHSFKVLKTIIIPHLFLINISISKSCANQIVYTHTMHRWALKYHYGTLVIFWYHDSLEALYIEALQLYWHWSDNLISSWCWVDTNQRRHNRFNPSSILCSPNSKWELDNNLIQSKTDVGTGLLQPCSWQDREMSTVIPVLWCAYLDLSGEISLLSP